MDRVEEASVLTMLIRLVSVIDGCVPSRMNVEDCDESHGSVIVCLGSAMSVLPDLAIRYYCSWGLANFTGLKKNNTNMLNVQRNAFANISFLLLLSSFSIQTLSLVYPLLQVQLLDRVLVDKLSVLLFSGSPNLGNTNSTLISKNSIQLQQSLVSAMNSTTPFNPYEQSFTLLGLMGHPSMSPS